MLADRGAPMQINTSIPMHVARAYGVKPTAPMAPPTAAPAPTTGSVSALVGGRVSRPIDFNAEPAAAPPSHAFQMYTRAADKIEAAVAVQLGRSIDVTG